MKKHKEAVVGFLIGVDSKIIVNETNVSDLSIIAINLKIHRFNPLVPDVH